MKKSIALVLILLSGILSAQTLEDLLKAHDKAVGTLEKWQKLKTLKRSGKVKMDGAEFNYVEQIINEKTRRLELAAQGSTTVTVVSEGSGWKQVGSGKAKALSATEVSDGQKETVLMNNLIDHKARGCTMVLVGDDKSDDIFTHKIKLTKKNGEVEYYFLDPKTYLLHKMIVTKKHNGQMLEQQIYYSNYKVIAGIKIAQNVVIKDPLGDVLEENMCEKMDANLIFNKLLFEIPK